eukprot:GCRY01006351.1.p1 GENE.GCRY01006351.1~~GCRY01006351.1.p1  ORF type:complete len:128 (+),score=16.78 GCRY01006351.1:380-763(+)
MTNILEIARRGSESELLNLLSMRPQALFFQDQSGRSALHIAAAAGRTSMVHTLLQAGANPNLQDCYCSTPLHLACVSIHFDVFQELISFGADPYLQDVQQKTPMNWHVSLFSLVQFYSHAGYHAKGS